jgi:hypothetical protein
LCGSQVGWIAGRVFTLLFEMSILATKLRLTNAAGAVMHGDSVRYAALQAEVDICALRCHLEGFPAREETNESFQVLSKVQED